MRLASARNLGHSERVSDPTPGASASKPPTGLGISTVEFVALVAWLMALNALAIDVMLPALGDISADFALTNPNDRQLVVVAYVLGFGAPQLIWGPLSDRYGRRPVLFVALIGYSLMGWAAAWVGSFEQLIAVRLFQGMFAAGARVVAVAVVRDVYAGRNMARIMSWVMTVFMAVPITAPMIGQAVLFVAPWRWLFILLGISGLVMLVWTGLRLTETRPVQAERAGEDERQGYRALFRSRVALGYTAAAGIVFGALFAFIASAEQVFTEVFDTGESFVLWFAVIAGALAAVNIVNARLVSRFGMRQLSHAALIGFTVLSLLLLGLLATVGEHLALFIPFFALIFGLFGLIGANFNALAMEPFGRSAGTASAAYGFATTTASGLLGGVIGRFYDGTTLPLVAGFAALGLVSLVIVAVTERGRILVAGRE